MSGAQLPQPLEAYIWVRELAREGAERVFEAVLAYEVMHDVERRRHEWRVAASALGAAELEARTREEIRRFADDIEHWLAETKQQLVRGAGSLPTLAPIEDGA